MKFGGVHNLNNPFCAFCAYLWPYNSEKLGSA
jgi:hypothetical protein